MRFKARAFALAFLFAIFKILYISHSESHIGILCLDSRNPIRLRAFREPAPTWGGPSAVHSNNPGVVLFVEHGVSLPRGSDRLPTGRLRREFSPTGLTPASIRISSINPLRGVKTAPTPCVAHERKERMALRPFPR